MSEKEKTSNSKQKEPELKKEPEISSEQKQQILGMSEISIWLDSYDDIFSDFDPRPYSHRSLSDDFLSETKKASRDKAGKLELRLLIPEQQRDLKNENVIKKRLHEHFNKHATLLKKEIKKTRNKSLFAAFIGILMMLAATSIGRADTFATRFMFVLLEPAGWFTVWFALERLFYTAEQKKSELEFYKKMSKCEILFSSY